MAKVMLVEDDNNLREIYEARLRAEGYDIVSARDGEEGLVVAKAEKPDLIIADIMMPKISGFEMLDILRNTEGLKHVKVIMLTALGQSDDQQRATSLGADRYLVKSQVTLEDIVKAAHELLGDQSGDGGAASAAPGTPPPAAPAEPSGSPANTNAATDKIENFVAGATQEATPPAPAAPASPPAPATDAAADTDAKTSDDKLVADAAQALIDSTESKDEPDSSEPETEPEKAADSDSGSGSDNVTIAHKKIIKPLDGNEPKKDINSLLAAEEAKETDGQKQAAGTVAPNNTSDPGSIAL